MKKILVKPMKHADLLAVLQIADDAFGKSYIEKETLLNPKIFTQVATTDSGGIVGFSCGMVQDSELLNNTLGSLPQSIRQQVAGCHKIGITKSLAIRNDMKNSGVGALLFSHRMETFKAKGVEAILMPGWQKPDGTTSINNIAHRFGFQQLGVVNNYYYEESLRRGYYCPVCGAPPCQCSAVMYWKKIGKENV